MTKSNKVDTLLFSLLAIGVTVSVLNATPKSHAHATDVRVSQVRIEGKSSQIPHLTVIADPKSGETVEVVKRYHSPVLYFELKEQMLEFTVEEELHKSLSLGEEVQVEYKVENGPYGEIIHPISIKRKG